MAKEVTGQVTLLGVRASFLSVFEPQTQKQDDGTERVTYKGNFLVKKDALKTTMAKYMGKKMPILDAIRAASADAKRAKWGKDESDWPKLKADRICWRDGDQENWDGYEGTWYVSANSKVENKPLVLTNRKDANGDWMEAVPGGKASPYSGAWVNATIQIWAQDNKHGKRINAELKAIQFVRDGESFGGAAPVNPNELFDEDDVGSEGSLEDDDVIEDDDLI